MQVTGEQIDNLIGIFHVQGLHPLNLHVNSSLVTIVLFSSNFNQDLYCMIL